MNPLRARRLFAADGRTVVVAMDHAAFYGPMAGLDDPGRILDAIANTGVDAVLTTYGIASAFGSRLGRLGLILRADGGSSSRNPAKGDLRKVFSAGDAVRLGADAVACMGMIGFPEEASSLRVLSDLVSECAPLGLPVLAEMLVQGADGKAPSVADVGFAMRIGAELGADWIKAQFAPPTEEYEAAVRACYRPVVVLGGAKVGDERSLLDSVAQALAAGASGVAIGRNIWQHACPGGVARALVALVHHGADVDTALRELRE